MKKNLVSIIVICLTIFVAACGKSKFDRGAQTQNPVTTWNDPNGPIRVADPECGVGETVFNTREEYCNFIRNERVWNNCKLNEREVIYNRECFGDPNDPLRPNDNPPIVIINPRTERNPRVVVREDRRERIVRRDAGRTVVLGGQSCVETRCAPQPVVVNEERYSLIRQLGICMPEQPVVIQKSTESVIDQCIQNRCDQRIVRCEREGLIDAGYDKKGNKKYTITALENITGDVSDETIVAACKCLQEKLCEIQQDEHKWTWKHRKECEKKDSRKMINKCVQYNIDRRDQAGESLLINGAESTCIERTLVNQAGQKSINVKCEPTGDIPVNMPAPPVVPVVVAQNNTSTTGVEGLIYGTQMVEVKQNQCLNLLPRAAVKDPESLTTTGEQANKNLQELVSDIQKRFAGNSKAALLVYNSDLFIRPIQGGSPIVSVEFKKAVVDKIYAKNGSCNPHRPDEVVCPLKSITQASGSTLVDINQSRAKLTYGDNITSLVTYLDHDAMGKIVKIGESELEITTEHRVIFDKSSGQLIGDVTASGPNIESHLVSLVQRMLWTTKKKPTIVVGESSKQLLTEAGMEILLPDANCFNKDGDK